MARVAGTLLPQLRGEDGAVKMYIGANNYELYDSAYCDGHYCCRDCENCPIAEEILEDMEGDED